mgnify:CR=1 FL=1
MAGNRYCCTMRRSVNRERIDVTEIGLNSPKVLGLAVLGTGQIVTIACLRVRGLAVEDAFVNNVRNYWCKLESTVLK